MRHARGRITAPRMREARRVPKHAVPIMRRARPVGRHCIHTPPQFADVGHQRAQEVGPYHERTISRRPGPCAIECLCTVRGSRSLAQNGGYERAENGVGASCPMNMTAQGQCDQFTFSKEQAKVARGSHLSRLCLQGQPSDAASGGINALEYVDPSARRAATLTWIKLQGQTTKLRLSPGARDHPIRSQSFSGLRNSN